MTWLAFLVSLAHWPGFYAPHNLAGWTLLLLGLPLLALPPFGVRAALAGFACGVSLNAALAFAQWLGPMPAGFPVGCIDASPCGFMVNKNFLGDAAACAFAFALASRSWWALPGPALALALTPSLTARGAALLVLAWHAGQLLPRSTRRVICWLLPLLVPASLLLLALLLQPTPLLWLKAHLPSLWQRWEMWAGTFAALNWSGHGIETFGRLFMTMPRVAALFDLGSMEYHPHNEYLMTLFELGWLAPLAWLGAAALWWAVRHEPEGHVLVCLAILGTAQYPLRNPATFLVACLCLWAGLCAWRRRWLADGAGRSHAGPGTALRRLDAGHRGGGHP